MKYNIIFPALLFAVVFFVAFLQTIPTLSLSSFKNIHTRRHFFSKSQFESEFPKLEAALDGPDSDIKQG